MENTFPASPTVVRQYPVCQQFGTAPMASLQGRDLSLTGGTAAWVDITYPLPISTLHASLRLGNHGADGRVPPRGRPV